MIMEQILQWIEALEIFGLLQCVFVLGLVVLKATNLRESLPTVAFLTALGLEFAIPNDLSPRLAHWDAAGLWLALTCIPALSYLLILQIATDEVPHGRHLAVLALPVLGLVAIVAAAALDRDCARLVCPENLSLLRVFGIIPGAVVLLLLWLQRGLLSPQGSKKEASDRYWVVMAFIAFNVFNLGIDLPRAIGVLGVTEAGFIRTMFGLTFIYLVTTLVFRIEPKPVVLLPGAMTRRSAELTADEMALAERIKELMTLDKLYQEPSFSRADLARELNVSENVISRVINSAFAKSFRKLLNDHRVDEAKQLLRDSDYPITQIAFDVGFNSLASFNRVFKETVGISPTAYRASDDAKADAAESAAASPSSAPP